MELQQQRVKYNDFAHFNVVDVDVDVVISWDLMTYYLICTHTQHIIQKYMYMYEN